MVEEDFYEPSFLTAALALKKGEITAKVVKTSSELHLLQAVSTDADHPATEDAVYDRRSRMRSTAKSRRRCPPLCKAFGRAVE